MVTTNVLAASLVTTEMKEAFNQAISAVSGDVASLVSSALPVALGIMGLFLAINLGIGFFRSVSH